MKTMTEMSAWIASLGEIDVHSVHTSRARRGCGVIVWVEAMGLARERVRLAFRALPDPPPSMSWRLILQDQEKMSWHRAGGDVLCANCSLSFYEHPPARTNEFCHRLCDGSLVKT